MNEVYVENLYNNNKRAEDARSFEIWKELCIKLFHKIILFFVSIWVIGNIMTISDKHY